MNRFPRLLGVATLAYGVFAFLRPDSLTRHAELGDPDNPPESAVRLSQAIGVRDTISGLALMLVPAGRPLQAAVIARVAADCTDAIGFGTFAPTRKARTKVFLVAAAYAVLCASSYPSASAAGPVSRATGWARA